MKKLKRGETIGDCKRFFFDSGSFGLYYYNVIKNRNRKDKYAFFKTPEFWQYVNTYAEFIKKHQDGFTYYANVDVIGNPELSWDVLKYLEEKHGLKPVPVIHFGTSLDWLETHLESGYKFIGLGGLARIIGTKESIVWLDKIFNRICPLPNRLPIVKLHGFGVTSYQALIRYPWYSIDSSSWVKHGGYGKIYVPHKRGGKFIYHLEPYLIGASARSKTRKERNSHITNLPPNRRKIVQDWLDYVGVPLGKTGSEGELIKYGVLSSDEARYIVNIKFFEELRKWLPKYPWPFRIIQHKRLNT